MTVKEIWDEAKGKAQKTYEEEHGKGAWEEADKYEKEDYVFFELSKKNMFFNLGV